MQKITKRLIVWAILIALILMVPFLAMQFHVNLYDPGSGFEQMNWDPFDFILMGTVLFSVGLAYELVARRSKKTVYRVAFGVGLVGAFFLFWTNGAVGVIGSEDNPANLLYGAVLAVGLIGSLISWFKPRGMSYTLFTAAIIQMLIPVFALFIWPAQASWGEPGVVGVFVLNAFFAMLFAVSAMLFRRVSISETKSSGSDKSSQV